MNLIAEVDSSAARASWWARLHAALMPDYNRKATAYWWTVVALGAAALLYSLVRVAMLPIESCLQVAGGVAVAMLAGVFPVRIRRSTNSFAAGEVFIFLLLLLHGPAAATLAAGAEALVGSARTSTRWTSRIASPAMAALSMFAAGTILNALLEAMQRTGLTNAGLFIVATMLFSLVYFLFNTLLVTAVPRMKRNQPFEPADLLGMFGWVGIAFAGSAAVAALLCLTFRQSGSGVVMAVVPIIGLLLATMHYYFRQQDAHDAVRDAAAHAVAREAEVAARHLQELEASERRFHSAFTHASIGMALLSFEGRVLQANAALRTLFGVDDASLRRHCFQDFVVADDLGALAAQLAQVSERSFDSFGLELRCRHSDGSPVWVAAHCSFFSEPGSTSPCLILQAQDISARRQAEAGLHQLAFHDSLTGLPNRRRFRELLADAVHRAEVDTRQRFAVMFLDFDRFKLINDSLGHSAGDDFLILVSSRIRDSVRPEDVVARLGGDEFAVLITDEHDVIAMAERLLNALRHPFYVAGTEVSTSASIGITSSSIGYYSPEDVLRDADIAMYKAKAAGKARYALFDIGLRAAVTQRMRLEGELRRAVKEDAITVVYQPLFDLGSGALTGFEALARWSHPEHGRVDPDVFIPIAEETGLIIALTDTVLHRACHQLRAWQLADAESRYLTMHVNIAGKDLAQPGLVARVTHALVDSGLASEALTLELTENILMERLETALPTLNELRDLGIGLSVDDFGTGYSSLAHLSTLPIDSLKVDRSFVRGLRPHSKEATIVRAIVHLGNSLGKRVIAEGIETASQFAQLREMGCEGGQGFHLSQPLSASGIELLLARKSHGLPPVASPLPSRAAPLIH
jgi:diguanylate cyclase (GGDEF)-like protein/PAS domain S-box-containing protein